MIALNTLIAIYATVVTYLSIVHRNPKSHCCGAQEQEDLLALTEGNSA